VPDQVALADLDENGLFRQAPEKLVRLEELAAAVGYLSEAELVENLLEISRSSVPALDGLWSPTGGGDSIALNDTTEDEAGPRGVNAARDRRGPRVTE